MKVIGSFLIFVGLVQLWWASYLLSNSLHMGSPIRLHGQRFVASLPPENQQSAQGFLDLGSLGFSLLNSSFYLALVTGATLLLIGGILVVRKYAKRSSSGA